MWASTAAATFADATLIGLKDLEMFARFAGGTDDSARAGEIERLTMCMRVGFGRKKEEI